MLRDSVVWPADAGALPVVRFTRRWRKPGLRVRAALRRRRAGDWLRRVRLLKVPSPVCSAPAVVPGEASGSVISLVMSSGPRRAVLAAPHPRGELSSSRVGLRHAMTLQSCGRPPRQETGEHSRKNEAPLQRTDQPGEPAGKLGAPVLERHIVYTSACGGGGTPRAACAEGAPQCSRISRTWGSRKSHELKE
jgi:hypothetical protein